MIPSVVKIEGDVRSKRIEVTVNREDAGEEVVRTLKQIGFPAED